MAANIGDVGTVIRQANMPEVRDVAVRKLRDVTIAVAIASAAGVGVIAWLSAATIPGSSGTPGLTGNVATGVDDQPISSKSERFKQPRPGATAFGPGVAVSGGSR